MAVWLSLSSIKRNSAQLELICPDRAAAAYAAQPSLGEHILWGCAGLLGDRPVQACAPATTADVSTSRLRVIHLLRCSSLDIGSTLKYISAFGHMGWNGPCHHGLG